MFESPQIAATGCAGVSASSGIMLMQTVAALIARDKGPPRLIASGGPCVEEDAVKAEVVKDLKKQRAENT